MATPTFKYTHVGTNIIKPVLSYCNTSRGYLGGLEPRSPALLTQQPLDESSLNTLTILSPPMILLLARTNQERSPRPRRVAGSGEKYESVTMDNGYNKYMMLKVRGVSQGDFGSYKCVAKNSLGETDGLIKLDGEYSQLTGAHTSVWPRIHSGRQTDSSNWTVSTRNSPGGSYKCVAKNSLGETDGLIKLDEIPAPSTTSTFTATAVTTPISSRKKDECWCTGEQVACQMSAISESVLPSHESPLFPGQRYRKQWKPRLEGGNRSRDYEVEGWRDSGEVERFRLRRLYATIPGSTSRDTELRPPSEGPLVPTLLFVLPATLRGQLIPLVPTPSAMALLYSHPGDCNVLYGLERGGKGTPIRPIKLGVEKHSAVNRQEQMRTTSIVYGYQGECAFPPLSPGVLPSSFQFNSFNLPVLTIALTTEEQRGGPGAPARTRNTNRFLIIDERVSTVWKDGEVHYLVASHVYPGDQASRRSNTALDEGVGGSGYFHIVVRAGE
uniref:Ig-like domain-containing protein n=1 Tax=Timema poppense TaxID=170557 RepID=A0A7R9DNN1_TIMPO|nr:unnamed protein product [Timema poppensis]